MFRCTVRHFQDLNRIKKLRDCKHSFDLLKYRSFKITNRLFFKFKFHLIRAKGDTQIVPNPAWPLHQLLDDGSIQNSTKDLKYLSLKIYALVISQLEKW